jgi:hypothetical protein
MKHLIFVWIIFHLCSCSPKPIDIDISPASPKMVIASQIIPKKVMFVNITNSFSALDGANVNIEDSLNIDFLNSISVKDAIVTVTYLDQQEKLVMVNPGIYASNNILQYEYGNYFIRVINPATNQEATATTTLIPKVLFDTVYPSITRNANDTTVNINFTLTDNPSAENYYVINYISKRKNNKQTAASLLDINQAFKRGNNSVNKEFELLDDNSFENGVYKVNKTIRDISTDDSLAVVLSNVSKGYYEYLNAFKRSGADINQLIGEPINFPTNVNNGYGYFNAYYPSVYYFDFKNH